MIHVMLTFWVISGFLLLRERKIIRIIIYLGIFSLSSTLSFLFLAAPDVALAEASMGVFTTIFFIICFEKYYGFEAYTPAQSLKKPKRAFKMAKLAPLLLSVALFGLFLYFIPDAPVNTYLRDLYLDRFAVDVGGENAVTAIYLGYRVYDTLFEALILLVGVVAVIHMSWHTETSVKDGRHSDIETSNVAIYTIRAISPLILLFGVYLIINGIYTPGGGFQGGVVIATFFVCRFMIYNIFDLRIGNVIAVEKVTFVLLCLLAIFVVFMGAFAAIPERDVPLFQTVHLVMTNVLIGVKVACGFVILFYRYVAIDRR